jgi:hypothetical protein
MDHPFSPEEQLRAGAAILGELFEPAGFTFALSTVGNSSGGRFAIGEFIRGNHRLELHYRFGLGIVIYHVGDCSLSHAELMRSQGFSKHAEFPTILDKSLRGFHAILSDLRKFGGPFLDADASQFAILAEWCAKNPKPTGFKALSNQ